VSPDSQNHNLNPIATCFTPGVTILWPWYYYKDKYHRLKARRGSQRAAMAIAHKILVAVFHMLAKTIPFQELGETFLDQQARTRTTRNLVRRLNNLGYDVLIRPKVAA